MARPDPTSDHMPPRFDSHSPRNHLSNLTTALRAAEASREATLASSPSNQNPLDASAGRPVLAERHGSTSMLGSSFFSNSGARPIHMKDRQRRESNNMGSFAGGMSWGGTSVGSWIRDDIMMSTSPAPFTSNSPSFHSSSYLPKMEADFMRDFTCCGLTLASLHDLLQHFEETHANAPPSSAMNGIPPPSVPTTSAASGQTQGDHGPITQIGFQPRPGLSGSVRQRSLGLISRSHLATVQDVDSMEDMDIDMDGIGLDGLDPIEEAPTQFPVQQNQFSQNQSQLPQLNINLAVTVHDHPGLRTSTPTTPAASQQLNLQNNPTVSSVNTPTLGTMSMHNSHNLTSPESSHPGTPAELDMDMTNFNPLIGMGMDMNFNFNNGNFGLSAFDNNGTIDQPGKRLFSKQSTGLSQAQLQAALKNYSLGGDQGELARLQEQQFMDGANIPKFPFPAEEKKPFRCPVIGCEKAYKNQNGLKYHKSHGHLNQTLKENDDGTFSIVDPETCVPYPGNIGMEKEKPYRCEFCGKRYKNLNGLKYHKAHSPNCNPQLALQRMAMLGNLSNLQQSSNVAGAGLGVDPSMF